MKMDDNWDPVMSGDSGKELARNAKLITAKKRKVFFFFFFVVLLVLTVCVAMVFFIFRCTIFGDTQKNQDSERGYYYYQDTTYYYQNGVWYEYDSALGWVLANPEDSFLDNYKSYYNGSFYENQNGVSDFRVSGYYKPYDSGTNNDYDNGMNLENSDIYDFEEEFER